MARTSLLLLFLLSVIAGTGCIPMTPQQANAFRSPKFKPDATFKVVSLNTGDQVVTAFEQELMSQGLTVIADNYLRTQTAPAGNVTISTRDTTYNTTQYRSLGVEIFEEKPSDYVVRYAMSWRVQGTYFDHFNASVINTATGAVEFTYDFTQGYISSAAYKDVHSVLQNFVLKMLAKG